MTAVDNVIWVNGVRILRNQQGFSLLEVLIAGVLMSIGLLSYAHLSLRAIMSTSVALESEQARYWVREAQAISILAGKPAAGLITTPTVLPATCRADAVCSEVEFQSALWAHWQLRVKQALPRGRAVICFDSTPNDGDRTAVACDNHGPLMVKVFWQPQSLMLSDPRRLTQELIE